ncbi:MAG: hypothetical protein ACPGJV_11705 [Bacteriovoracaceae bacterium]
MNSSVFKNSGIVVEKSKFFLIRILSYFSFLLIPLWIQKTLYLSNGLKIILMTFYVIFMIGQWFLLGKEIDHRLKIYFKVNSTIDRLAYRILMGMLFTCIYFNILYFLLPPKWIYNTFWVTWAILGLYYSWPTRGKIIKESVSSNFNEIFYLDSFEKTLLGLTILMIVVSIPQFPKINDWENLKLFFDPLSRISDFYWNFIFVNYYPFKNYPVLFKIATSLHFYLVGIGLFLVFLYGLIRNFSSRRLALLGVFALTSSWSLSKIFSSNYGDAIITTYALIWIWSFLWVIKSSSYRTGLFLGLVSFYGALLNVHYIFFGIISFFLVYFFNRNERNLWYTRQTFRYMSFGFLCACVVFYFGQKGFPTISVDGNYGKVLLHYISRKAFFILSVPGALLVLLMLAFPNLLLKKNFNFDREKLSEFVILLGLVILFCLFADSFMIYSFGIMWIFAFLSVIPIEFLFQVITRYRYKRNMIYLIYILTCLLDSHFEGRVKILYRLIDSPM